MKVLGFLSPFRILSCDGISLIMNVVKDYVKCKERAYNFMVKVKSL